VSVNLATLTTETAFALGPKISVSDFEKKIDHLIEGASQYFKLIVDGAF
jgi:hypothetical protein